MSILAASVQNPLRPRARYAASRRWSFWVNTVAASPYTGRETRKRIYRSMGMEIDPEAYGIGPGCYFHSADVAIGAQTMINDRCWFENTGRLTIGSGVAIAPHVVIVTSTHRIGPRAARASGGWEYRPVTIGDGCWIGARALIQPGVTVAPGCIIAAGAVVTADTEPDRLYGGVPARPLRHLDAPTLRVASAADAARTGA